MAEPNGVRFLTLEEQLGSRIHSARKSIRISQRELADRAGLTQAVISKIEVGSANPTLQTVQRISEALNMNVSLSLNKNR